MSVVLMKPLFEGTNTVKAWQHISTIDHLRRSAENQIKRARSGHEVSYAAGGKDAPLNDETKTEVSQSKPTVPPKFVK